MMQVEAVDAVDPVILACGNRVPLSLWTLSSTVS
jgi:hypothetical protein